MHQKSPSCYHITMVLAHYLELCILYSYAFNSVNVPEVPDSGKDVPVGLIVGLCVGLTAAGTAVLLTWLLLYTNKCTK